MDTPEIDQNINLQFGKPEEPRKYESQIEEVQRKILAKGQPFLPNKLSADVAFPAIKEGRTVGFGFLFLDKEHAKLMYMVDPKHQHQGLGMRIVKKIEEVAKGKGAKEVSSFIVDNIPQAQKAMKSAGYQIRRTEPGRILYVKELV